MKLNVDVSDTVMRKVAKFEKRRSVGRIYQILLAMGFCGIAFITVSIFVGYDVWQKQAYALFELFGEDWEIVGEYWKDTLYVFWEELSHPMLLIGLIVLAFGIIIFISTRHRRRVANRRLAELAKLEKKE